MSKDSPRTSVLRDNDLIQKGQDDLIRRGDALSTMSDGDDIVGPDYPEWFINRYATINAIPAVQPTVAPLAWRSNGKGRVCADTPFGLYEVEHGRYGMRLLHGGSFMQDDLQGIEAAKAAAQADYEASILSALDMQPTVSPDVAALVEAAFQEGFLAGTADGWANNPRIKMEWKRSCSRAALASVKGEPK